MNFFDKLKAQVNMNDGGKTFSNPEPVRGPIQQSPGLTQLPQDASQMPRGMQFQSGLRDQRAKDVAPFRMFEDGSFQGIPSQSFRTTNPGYNFYEDNSFSSPAQLSVGGSQGYGQLDDSQVLNPQGYSYGVRGMGNNPINGQSLQGSDIRKLLGY
jgi:hypothetical protein